MSTLKHTAYLVLLALAGCSSTHFPLLDDHSVVDGGAIGAGNGDGDNGEGDGDWGDGDWGDGDGDTGGASGTGGSGGTGTTDCTDLTCVPDEACQRGLCSHLPIDNVDKVDLLFMIDNSNSMRDEQASLAREFQRLINVLTTGDHDGDGQQDFSAARDLHLGVISSDLGVPGVPGVHELAGSGCEGLGDNGILHRTANLEAACSTTSFDPPFLTYLTVNGDSPAQLATDFSCIAALGVDGCGFEQQLESMLKAVWPGSDSQVRFVADPATGFGTTGQAGPGFPNGDFGRPDSVLGLVMVTDEEDCSSNRMDHFIPSASPAGLNTRCFFEGQRAEPNNLYDVERYIQTFKALRPGQEHLVIFSAIVGVPPELVTPEQLNRFDFSVPAQSDAFFDGLLATPAMQETLDPRGNMDPSDDNLVPSCDRGMDARAYPPRRIVQVAKAFGANGVVQSICQEDFRPAIDPIIERIASQLGSVCLPVPLDRLPDGSVACDVYWKLPVSRFGDAPTLLRGGT